jgi:hypothetical protein
MGYGCGQYLPGFFPFSLSHRPRSPGARGHCVRDHTSWVDVVDALDEYLLCSFYGRLVIILAGESNPFLSSLVSSRTPISCITYSNHVLLVKRCNFGLAPLIKKMSRLLSTSIITTLSQSIFVTPSFIIVELCFLISSLVAAYELFIGDFVWAREEEERRSTIQKSRGRGMVAGQRQLYQPTQRPYHRSLSPGRGGRGSARGHGATEDETSSLLHGRRSSRRLNESALSEEGSFPSPGDMRSVEMGSGLPGRGGSAGDTTRRLVRKFFEAKQAHHLWKL